MLSDSVSFLDESGVGGIPLRRPDRAEAERADIISSCFFSFTMIQWEKREMTIKGRWNDDGIYLNERGGICFLGGK